MELSILTLTINLLFMNLNSSTQLDSSSLRRMKVVRVLAICTGSASSQLCIVNLFNSIYQNLSSYFELTGWAR